jgi:hypothetical protein
VPTLPHAFRQEESMSFDPQTTHRQEAATPAGSATLTVHNKQYEFPVVSGTLGPNVIDITKLYGLSGGFTYDPGFTSTASCKSDVTFTDGERGMLFYRGYPIEQLAEHGTLPGNLPHPALRRFAEQAALPRFQEPRHLPHDAA